MRIFLIAGKAGSGKNEVARLIKEKRSKTVITGLSKYIKLFALELTDWDGVDDNKPRTFLQEMGDYLRAVDIDFLTKRMKEDILVYEKLGYQNVIISDVRLLHEIEYFKKIKNIEVITIEVRAKEQTRQLSNKEMNHQTEIELDNYDSFDYVIENNLDDKLNDEVDKILEGLK